MERAVNPKTGEVVFLVNNQWIKPSETARNAEGDTAYLVRNQWQIVKAAPEVEDKQPSLGSPMGEDFGSSIMAAAAPMPVARTPQPEAAPSTQPPGSISAQDYLAAVAKRKEDNPDRSVSDVAIDSGITFLKATIGLPESFVGLADIPTAGRIGKFLEEKGYKPKEAKAILDTYLSEAQQAANRKVKEAEGFGPTLVAGLQNPSVIATSAAESLPQMLGGAGAARGIMKAAPSVAPWLAGALGEGLMGAGSSAEQMRQDSATGLLSGKQSLAAVGSGVGTAAFGAAAGRLANKLGLDDVETMLASGATQGKSKSVTDFAKRAGASGISEGVFEEMPQSAQEQMWMNYATDKPIMQGVPEASAMGLLTGAAMGIAGAGAGQLRGKSEQEQIPSAEQMMRDRGFLAPEKTTTPATEPSLVDILKPAEQPPAPASMPFDLSGQRAQEQKSVLDLEKEFESEAPIAEEKPAASVAKPEIEKPAQPAVVKVEEDYANKSLEELQTLRDNADQTNDALDLAAVTKHFGPEVAAEYEKMSRRQRNKWWDANATEALDRDASTFNGVNEDLLDDYIKAHNDFATESPQALGRSVGLLARKINDPGFVGSPDFVRLKNALSYAKQQGWNENEVLNGMRERASEWAGADAQELFKDLFKPKATGEAAGKPQLSVLPPAAEEEEAPFVGEDLSGQPMPARPEVKDLLTKQAEATKAIEDLSKRTAGTSLIKVLQGTLKNNEMSELGGRSRQIGKNPFISLVAKKGKPGSSMEDMVDSGALDLFLPENMRPGADSYVNSESAEYIREKLRQNQYYTYDTQMEIERVTRGLWDLEKLIQEELSIDEINKEIERAFDEQRQADLDAEANAPEGKAGSAEQRKAAVTNDELDKREAQLEREAQLNEREARLLEERKRLEEERLKLESPTKADVVEQEERKAKAAEQDEKDQIRKESEAGAGQFELTREEGRQDTTGNLFDQPAAEPEPVQISPEQERKEAMDNFTQKLAVPIPPFRAQSARGTQLLKPTRLSKLLTKEVVQLASDALDLGLPAAVLGNVTAAGSTRMNSVGVMSESGWLMLAQKWSTASSAQKLQVLIHELAHSVDFKNGKLSNSAEWKKAHAELKKWYDNSAAPMLHPLAYPFAPQFKRRARPYEESFAQAFSFYFTLPADLQKNAPEAYSQIQAIVERINNGSQTARAAGTTATGTAGIKIQPSRAEANTAVQSAAGSVSTAVSPATRLEDRGSGQVSKAVEFREDIPNETWLKGKIESAQRSPRNEFGVPQMSSVTGYFKKPVLIPARWFKDVKGERGEQENVRQNDLAAIRKIIRETGKMPLNDDGTEYVPYIEIGYDGKPWISEGNHRIMAAIAEGMEYIPVELRYFDGGQRRAGVWGPGNVTSITERVEGERAFEINPAQAALVTDTPAFKRWFGNSKVVDADGKPLVVYHGTKEDFDSFNTVKGIGKGNALGPGAYFSPNPGKAALYAGEGSGANMVPAYLAINNPLDTDPYTGPYFGHVNDRENARLRELGYDGIIVRGYIGGPIVEAVAFRPNQIKSATGNSGEFNPEAQEINASFGTNIFGNRPLANWTTPDQTSLDQTIKYLQNNKIDTLRVIQAIEKNVGQIEDAWNPYLKETNFHGRVAKQTRDFENHELKPLFNEMRDFGVSMDELEEYLHNRHAQERNDQIAQVNPGMPDKGSGIATADAQTYLSGLPQDKLIKYQKLAKMVDSITSNTRQLLVDSGLESQFTIDQWENTYKHYIPLNRDDVDYTSNHGMSVGQGFSVKGPASRRATGSEREVVDILANIAMQRERNIVRAEKNRVATALYGLALKNPNPKFWLPVNPDAKKNVGATVNELVQMGFMPSDVRNLMEEPRKTEIDPTTGLVREVVHQIGRGADNVMSLRVNGENRYVFFNQNDDRANSMVRALKNLDADQLGPILSNTALATRYIASVNTQFNPVFGALNFIRDLQGAALQLSTTELAGEQKAVGKNIMPALVGIYKDLRLQRDGKVGRGQWSRLWEDFQQHGGQTGFRDQFSRSEDRGRALQKIIDPSSWADSKLGKIFTVDGRLTVPIETARKAAAPLFNWLSDYNETMENAVRLAAYKVALDKGFSKDRAASIAKNLTVNFNRKGDVAAQAGSLYAFFNASVQGTTRLAQTLAGPAGKAIIGGGLLLGTIEAIMMSMAGFGDDDPPDFVKEKNFIIPIMSTGKYIAIPLPLGYSVIPNFSRLLTEATIRYLDGRPIKATETTFKILDSLMGAFNPIGNAGWSFQTFAPTLADPFVALGENKDWTGKKIAREDFNSLNPTPGYLRAKESASTFGRAVSKWLNAMSGGTEDVKGKLSPTPDQIDYLVGQATGGVGREALKIERAIRSKVTGEELPSHAMPIVGRFYGDTKESSSVANNFYANLVKMNEYENTIKGMVQRKENVSQFLKENPEATLYKTADQVERNVQKLRKLRHNQVEKGAPKEVVRGTEKLITNQMKVLNDKIEQREKQRANQ